VCATSVKKSWVKEIEESIMETQIIGTTLPAKFGPFGGQFVPETLMPALSELVQGVGHTWKG
jgi:hypothetical protein